MDQIFHDFLIQEQIINFRTEQLKLVKFKTWRHVWSREETDHLRRIRGMVVYSSDFAASQVRQIWLDTWESPTT